MKKRLKRKRLSAALQDEPGAIGLIGKVQQQLSAMEKKLDILISQSSKRPFEKSYPQKPFGNFNHPHRHDREGQDNRPRERIYTRVICADCKKECEVPFKPSGDRPVYCKECLIERRKGNPFNTNRDRGPEEKNFLQKPRSDKKQAKKREKRAKKKKPFYSKLRKFR